MLLRRVIGDALRARRQGQHRTLREISTAANVSLGYLSEIERGQKEASSELLASICEALGSQLSEVLREASDSLARAEHPGALVGAEPAGLPEIPAARGESAADEAPKAPATRAIEAPLPPPMADRGVPIPAGEVSVSVRRDGPLRTTLHAVRTRPGRRVAQHR
ncbi:helix-turn-helix domain-containing protein [Natronosporangium hydrolyticum]|uniref:helix-turn-helix domain-containing protein n=1 Tax=Natronosporangium hydrolyticum TaxID=2811111 RepID=UPI001EFA0915|nr:helix-turn-helix transcriptional regulator [Natronosporangium hydrolyticum]